MVVAGVGDSGRNINPRTKKKAGVTDPGYNLCTKKDSGSARQGETTNTINVQLPESP